MNGQNINLLKLIKVKTMYFTQPSEMFNLMFHHNILTASTGRFQSISFIDSLSGTAADTPHDSLAAEKSNN